MLSGHGAPPGFRHLGGHRSPSTGRLLHLDSSEEVISHGHPSVPCPKKVTVPTSEARGEVSAATRWHWMACLSLDLGPTVQVASRRLPL